MYILSIDEINPYRHRNVWITGRKLCVFSYAKTVVVVGSVMQRTYLVPSVGSFSCSPVKEE
jgi:hypothetical protein